MSVLVETERLVLRPPEPSDVQPMFEIHQDPDVVRFLGTGTPGDITVAWRNVAMMVGHWHMRGYGPWIITRKKDEAIIGRAGLWHADGGPGVELGWMIRRDAWGHGFATEAARAALEWAWQHVGTDRIVSIINADNRPSIRIAERLGQTLERRDVVNGAEVCTFAITRTTEADPSRHPRRVQLRSSVPVFLVADVDATAAWYRQHLGFETAGIFPPRPPSAWASLQRDRAEIMLQRLPGYQKPDVYDQRTGGVWHSYIRLTGVARFYDAIEHEPFIKTPLRKQPYGDWEFEVEDLNGYVLVFGGDETVP